LVDAVRDYAFEVTGDAEAVIDAETARQGLEYNGTDDFGLDDRDRRVFRQLCEEFLGGPVGIKPLAASLGMEPGTLTGDVEPYLLQAGLLRLQRTGRCATRATYLVLGKEIPPVLNGNS
jgi:Holliday junction DNA helicase RuvB